MGPEPLSLIVFTALLKVELSAIDDEAIRDVTKHRLIPPRPKTLVNESNKKEMYVAWLFAEDPEQRQGAVYCDRGPAYREQQWGVVEIKRETIGSSTQWFPSVNGLIAAWMSHWGSASRDAVER